MGSVGSVGYAGRGTYRVGRRRSYKSDGHGAGAVCVHGMWAQVQPYWGDAASRDYSSVSGGRENIASATYSSIGGGESNAADCHASLAGGGRNRTASGSFNWLAARCWRNQ